MDLFVKIKQRHPVCDTPFIIKFYSPVKWHAFNSMLIPRAITIKQAVKTSRQIGWRKSSGVIRTWERIIHQFNHITLRYFYIFQDHQDLRASEAKRVKRETTVNQALRWVLTENCFSNSWSPQQLASNTYKFLLVKFKIILMFNGDFCFRVPQGHRARTAFRYYIILFISY